MSYLVQSPGWDPLIFFKFGSNVPGTSLSVWLKFILGRPWVVFSDIVQVKVMTMIKRIVGDKPNVYTIINPQRMREGYSSQSCLSVCLSVYLLHLFWNQQRLERFNFSLNNI